MAEAVPVDGGFLCVHCFDDATPGVDVVGAVLVAVSGPRLCLCCGLPLVLEEPETGDEVEEYFGPPNTAWKEWDGGDYELSAGSEYDGGEDEQEGCGADWEPQLQPAQWWAAARPVRDRDRPLARSAATLGIVPPSDRGPSSLRWACRALERRFGGAR